MVKSHLSTKAKRKAMAARVGRVASETLGIPVKLTPDYLDPGEYSFRAENLETTCGPLHWLTIDVCRRGVNVHTKFGFPEYAPPGANRHSGKWNHYIWLEDGESPNEYAEVVECELAGILQWIVLRDVCRADRPGLADYRAHEREKFAAECAARKERANA